MNSLNQKLAYFSELIYIYYIYIFLMMINTHDTRQCIQSAISNWSTTILLNTSMIPFCLLFLIPQLFSPPTMFTRTISMPLMIISMVRPAPSLFIPPISMSSITSKYNHLMKILMMIPTTGTPVHLSLLDNDDTITVCLHSNCSTSHTN